ncbi:adenylate/guanylate cyclase domain-containing protein [Bradyrhizobium sp. INPA03-11B]|uniref:adenylate/guanylate cyclase domain-containing protein n=1 Tax=Bradyrhizobium sp. INPA03-11B TaxID=418598 RepID=UPI00338EC549
MAPKTCYAKSGELSIAYQVVGEGPFDLVFVPGFVSNVDQGWEMPLSTLYRRLASFSRLIIFDKRGTGLSDRNCGIPSLEERIDDVRAVMAAAGSRKASILGFSEGCPMALMFAACYPNITRSIVLYGAHCKSPGWAPPPLSGNFEWVDQHWGTGATSAVFAPSLSGETSFREMWARYERAGASPSALKSLIRMNAELDVGPILGSVRTPCLLLHRAGDRAANVEASRSLARHLPDAKYIELPGDDHAVVGDTSRLYDEIEEFLTGSRPTVPTSRVLATVLFTDIVDSTKRARELGDHAWQELLGRHNQLVRAEITRFSGHEIKTLGDGFLATFDGPARALRCASAIVQVMPGIGLSVRAGLHIGEIEASANDVNGIAVHVAARVVATAAPNQVLVSSTLKDLVAGSNIKFQDHGSRTLKGLDHKIRLFEVAAR